MTSRRTHNYIDSMFADTLTGYMLRMVYAKRSMLQRDVMREFHAKSRALGQRKTAGKSSFAHAFTRLTWSTERHYRDARVVGSTKRFQHPGFCLHRVTYDSQADGHNVVAWGVDETVLLGALPAKELHDKFTMLERRMMTDEDPTVLAWVALIRREIARRG